MGTGVQATTATEHNEQIIIRSCIVMSVSSEDGKCAHGWLQPSESDCLKIIDVYKQHME